MPSPHTLKTITYYILAFLGSSVVMLLLATGAVYYVAVSNQGRVPELAAEWSRNELGVELSFSDYRFEYFDHFPFLSLSLRNLVLTGPDPAAHRRELLRIKEADLVLKPSRLLYGELGLRSLWLDDTRILIFKSGDGASNIGFLKRVGGNAHLDTAMVRELGGLRRLHINGLYFDYQDSLRYKFHRFEIRDGRLSFAARKDTLEVGLDGESYIHGLTFRPAQGAYAEGAAARLDLRFSLTAGQGAIALLPGAQLKIGPDTIRVAGVLSRECLQLELSTEGINQERGEKIVAPGIRDALSGISVEGSLAVRVHVNGEVVPGSPVPVSVSVSGYPLSVRLAEEQLTGVGLRAGFINNHLSHIITPETGRLRIEVDTALWRSRYPFALVYEQANLQQPIARVTGGLQWPASSLQPFLNQAGWALDKGRLTAAFSVRGPMQSLAGSSPDWGALQWEGKGRVEGVSARQVASGAVWEKLSGQWALTGKALRFSGGTFEFGGGAYSVGLRALLGEGKLNLHADVEAPPFQLEPWLALVQDSAVSQPLPWDEVTATLQVQAPRAAFQRLAADGVTLRASLSKRKGEGWQANISSMQGVAFGHIPFQAQAGISSAPTGSKQLALAVKSHIPLTALQPLVPSSQLLLRAGEASAGFSYNGDLSGYAGLSAKVLVGLLKGQVRLHNAAWSVPTAKLDFDTVSGGLFWEQGRLYWDSLSVVLNGNQATLAGQSEGVVPFLLGQRRESVIVDMTLDSRGIDLNRFSFPGRWADVEAPGSNPVRRAIRALLPRLEARLEARSDSLRFRAARFDEVYWKGALTPEEPFARVDTLSAKVFGGAPIQAKAVFSNPSDPMLAAEAEVAFPVRELSRMFSPSQLRFDTGTVQLRFRYSGQPHRHVDAKNALLNAKVSGTGKIKGAGFTFVPRGYAFRKVDAAFAFNGNDLHFDGIGLSLNGNSLQGHGVICDFLPFIFLPQHRLRASLDVHAGHFDLGRFRAPEKFREEATGGAAEQPTVITRLINAGLSSAEADFSLSIDTLSYRNFQALDVEGAVGLGQGRFWMEGVRMGLAGGRFELAGEVDGIDANRPAIDIQARLADTDIRSAFHAFDNFGQRAIRSNNLEGQLTADVQFRARANANYDLLPEDMQGYMKLSVENGALIGLPALDSLRSLLFSRSNLGRVEFGRLEGAFVLNGQLLYIGQLPVRASLLSFTVGGQYDMGEQGRTNLLFEVPLSNLFNREKWGGSRLGGPDILLRARDREDREGLHFKWVISRKE